MSIAWPACEVISPRTYGPLSSYTGTLFHNFCSWRDQKAKKSDGFLLRITSELAFVALSVASLIESIVRLIFAAFRCGHTKALFSTNLHAAGTFFLSIGAVAHNLFVKNISSKLRNTFFTESPLFFIRQRLLPLKFFDKRLIEAKLLSHWLELQGKVTIKGKKVELEGGNFDWMFPSVANSLAAFSDSKEFKPLSLTREKALLLKEALENFQVDSAFAHKVRSKQLCFLQTGWDEHAICLCFFNGYMAIGNKGGGATDFTTLKVYKIDPDLMTEQIVNEINHLTDDSKEKALKYLYETLPNKLSPTGVKQEDPLCDLFKNTQPMYAPVGNCTLSSIQATLPFAWAMLTDPQPTEELVQKAELETLLFQNWAAIRYADLILPNNKFDDPEFLAQVSRAKKIKTVFLEHLEKLSHPPFKNDPSRSKNYLKALHWFNYLNHKDNSKSKKEDQIELEKLKNRFNDLFIRGS